MTSLVYGYQADPPSEQVVRDMRIEAARVCKEIVARGAGKVVRVRVEIDFGDGSEIAHEATS